MQPQIFIENLSFRYRRAQELSLFDIYAEALPGRCVVIMGAGGSGKSSLCYTVNGIIPHLKKGEYRGRVGVNGLEVAETRIPQLARYVGLVLQDFESQLFTSSVEAEVAFGLENTGVDRPTMIRRVEEYLQRFGLAELRAESPAILSGGQKQLLAICAVMAMEPQVLVMDEATSDLDPGNRQKVAELVGQCRERGTTLILSDHRPELALDADAVWLLSKGRLVEQGPPMEVMTNRQLLDECSVQMPDMLGLMQRLGHATGDSSIDGAERAIRHLFPYLPPRPRIQTDPPGGGTPAMEVSDVTHVFHAAKPPAIREVSFQLYEGEFLAVLGPNGSGKTTLSKHLVRLLEPTVGTIFLFGKSIRAYNRQQLAGLVAYVFQNPDHQIFAETVFGEVSFSLIQFGYRPEAIRDRVAQALKAVHLEGYENRDPAQLTKGERQRVAVASALVMRPPILILDEPTTGLDHHSQTDMMRMLVDLNQQGCTIIVNTHSLSIAARYATRILLLHEGRLVLDAPTRTAFSREDVFERTGIPVSPLIRLSNRLGLHSVTVDGMYEELVQR